MKKIIALAVLAAMSEIGLGALWIRGYHGIGLALLHGGAIVLFWAGYQILMGRSFRANSFRPMYLFAFLLLSFFPFFGLSAVVVLFFCVGVLGRNFHTGLFDEYKSYLEEHQEDVKGIGGYHHLLQEARGEVSFEPLVDIIRGIDRQKKIAAIEKLSRRMSPETLSLLKSALKDSSPEVRLHASSALLKLEGDINKKIEMAREAVTRHTTARAYSDLGELYWSYLEAGIMEKGLKDYYLGLAAEAYRNSLDLETNQPAVMKNYCDCLVRLGNFAEAKRFLDRAVRLWPGHEDIGFIRARVYFELGLIGELESVVGDIDSGNLDSSRREVWKLWTSQA